MAHPIGLILATFTDHGLLHMTALTAGMMPNRRGNPSRGRETAAAPIAQPAAAAAKAPKEPTKGKVLFVGNLKRSTNIQQLAAAFEPFGTVTALRLVVDKETGRSKGFGYVQYVDAADASKAMAQMHGRLVEGHKLKVTMAHQPNFMEF